jgi:nicotinate-nucleotide adenylyltransferase
VETTALRIALLGGSFNPPHVGHLMNAYYVLSTREVDRVWLMPVYQHPFAKKLAPFEDRLTMCELAAARFAGGVEVCDVEREVPGGRTVDTLERLVARYPEHRFLLIIGSDILSETSKWRAFDRVEQLAELVVVARAGYPSPRAAGPALPEVSSTVIRERLARGEDASALSPREVLAYAASRGLYRGEQG